MEFIFMFMGIEYHILPAIMCTSFIIVLCQMKERKCQTFSRDLGSPNLTL